MRLICVTLNDGDDWRDHRALLDWGFSLYERETLARAGELSYEIPVCGGEADSVAVSNADACDAVLPREHGPVSVRVELPRFVYAGIEKGDRIGSALREGIGLLCAKRKDVLAEGFPVCRVEKKELSHE